MLYEIGCDFAHQSFCSDIHDDVETSTGDTLLLHPRKSNWSDKLAWNKTLLLNGKEFRRRNLSKVVQPFKKARTDIFQNVYRALVTCLPSVLKGLSPYELLSLMKRKSPMPHTNTTTGRFPLLLISQNGEHLLSFPVMFSLFSGEEFARADLHQSEFAPWSWDGDLLWPLVSIL